MGKGVKGEKKRAVSAGAAVRGRSKETVGEFSLGYLLG